MNKHSNILDDATHDTEEYAKRLIAHIVSTRPYEGRQVFRDANVGSIYLELHGGACVYATPDYEGVTGLPIDIITESGDVLSSTHVTLEWSGDLDMDARLWARLVAAVIG